MHKDKLKDKFILYIDKDSAWRLGKVKKIVGNTLTILNAYGERHRIHPTNGVGCKKILGVLKKRKIRFKTVREYLEEIEWK